MKKKLHLFSTEERKT